MSCDVGYSSDSTQTPFHWKNETDIGYKDYRNDVLRDSTTLNSAYFRVSDLKHMGNALFAFKMKKILHKRSSEDSNSIDMPVVFMPKKSQAQCITKPKVHLWIIVCS